MIEEHTFEALVASIYEAGADFRRWPETLKQIAQAFDSRTVMLRALGRETEGSWLIAPDVDQEVHERYAAYYHDVNPVWRPASALPVGSVRTDAMLVPRHEFVTSEFYNDFLRPQDLGSMLGVTACQVGVHSCVASVQRSREYEAEDVAMYRRLAPHLQRALQLTLELARLEMRCTASAEVLDQLDRGAILVDGTCRVVFANRVAAKLIGDGGALRLVDGLLEATSATDTRKLQALVAVCGASAVSSPNAALSVSRGPRAAPLSLSILPLRTEAPAFLMASRPTAVIFINDADRSASTLDQRIKRRYGLSPKETLFALEVVKGEGLKACAESLRISHATARTHLAHIFQKTGARRQAELVRLLLQA